MSTVIQVGWVLLGLVFGALGGLLLGNQQVEMGHVDGEAGLGIFFFTVIAGLALGGWIGAEIARRTRRRSRS